MAAPPAEPVAEIPPVPAAIPAEGGDPAVAGEESDNESMPPLTESSEDEEPEIDYKAWEASEASDDDEPRDVSVAPPPEPYMLTGVGSGTVKAPDFATLHPLPAAPALFPEQTKVAVN